MKYKGKVSLVLKADEIVIVPQDEVWKLTLFAKETNGFVTACIGDSNKTEKVNMIIPSPKNIILGGGSKLGADAENRLFAAQGVAFTVD